MYYTPETLAEKRVSAYTGLDLREAGELCSYDFFVVLRDAVIWDCSGTKDGREYLKKCSNFVNKVADRAALREVFGGKEKK